MTPLLLQYGETSHLKNASSFYGCFCHLHHCNMSPSGQCLLCSEEETCLHLFITCLWSSSFWSFANIDIRFSDPCHIWGHRVFLASNVNKNDSSAFHYVDRLEMQICKSFQTWGRSKYSYFKMTPRWSSILQLSSNRCSYSLSKTKLLEWSNFFSTPSMSKANRWYNLEWREYFT